MKELLRGESTISLEAAVLKCPNAELYLYLFLPNPETWPKDLEEKSKGIDQEYDLCENEHSSDNSTLNFETSFLVVCLMTLLLSRDKHAL
jgi:hypothetical protein